MIGSVVVVAFLLSTVAGFAPASKRAFAVSTSLNSFVARDNNDPAGLFDQAMSCAESETCSIEDAENLLNEILFIKKGCEDGTLEDSDLCFDTALTAEIESNLRAKIEGGEIVIRSERSATQTIEYALAACMYLGVGLFALTVNYGGEDTQAFTLQEWWWALSNNYLPTMFAHFVRNGGL